MKTKELIAILLALASTLANAQEIKNTLYVSPNGDDANRGKMDRPFRTLTNAFAHLTSNTRLVISGNHTNACVPAGLSLPVGHLVLSNVSNVELVGTNGATLYFTGYGNGLHFHCFTNLTVQGLTFVGDRPSLDSMTASNTTTSCAMAIKGQYCSDLIVRDCRFIDWPDHAISVWVGSDVGPYAHVTDNVWVQNCYFQNIGGTNFPAGLPWPLDGTAISCFFKDNVWVENNYATNCLKFFEFEPAGDRSVSNLVAGNWHVTDNVLVELNGWLTFAHNNYGVSTHDIWIERNYVKRGLPDLITYDVQLLATTNAWVRDNTFVNCSGAVGMGSGCDNIVVEGNTFRGAESVLQAFTSLDVTELPCWNLAIRENTFDMVKMPMWLGAVNTVVEGNIFNGLPDSSFSIVVLNGGHAYGYDYRGWATNLTFVNNSFLPPYNPAWQSWLFTAGSNRLEEFTFSGNLDYCSTPVTMMFRDPPWTYARSNMFIDQSSGSTGTLNGNVKAAIGSRWVVDEVTYVNTGDATWMAESTEPTEPTIISHPSGQSQVPGQSATFTVRAGGTPPLSYQWRFNGVDIPGATASSFTVTNVQSDNLGNYSVLVANSVYSIASADAPLGFGKITGWGTPNYPSHGEIVPPVEATNLLAIASGYYLNLALKPDGSLQWWDNINLQAETTLPTDLTGFVAIAAGGGTGLALRSDGTVAAWGDNSFGQTDIPVDLTNVVAIAVGSFHSLALKYDGTVVAWGGSLAGEANVPAGLSDVVAIAAGSGFSLALRADGTVAAWGYSLGATPSIGNVQAIAAGVEHALALLEDGTVVAWGKNRFGQSSVPEGLSRVVAIDAGAYSSVALLSNGTVVEWGFNSSGGSNVPIGLTNVVAISAGDYHTLALVGSGPPALKSPLGNPALSETGFSVSVPSQSGCVYALEYRNSPADANWTRLPLAAGNGGNLILTDSTAPSSQRFYRVRRW